MKEFDEFYNKLIECITEQVEQKVWTKINVPLELEDLLTPDEVAQYLKVDKTTVYRLCKEGQLKSIKVGSIHSRKPHIRILKSDLNEWINKLRE